MLAIANPFKKKKSCQSVQLDFLIAIVPEKYLYVMPLDKKKNIRLSPHLLFEYNKVYLTEVFFKCDLLAL